MTIPRIGPNDRGRSLPLELVGVVYVNTCEAEARMAEMRARIPDGWHDFEAPVSDVVIFADAFRARGVDVEAVPVSFVERIFDIAKRSENGFLSRLFLRRRVSISGVETSSPIGQVYERVDYELAVMRSERISPLVKTFYGRIAAAYARDVGVSNDNPPSASGTSGSPKAWTGEPAGWSNVQHLMTSLADTFSVPGVFASQRTPDAKMVVNPAHGAIGVGMPFRQPGQPGTFQVMMRGSSLAFRPV